MVTWSGRRFEDEVTARIYGAFFQKLGNTDAYNGQTHFHVCWPDLASRILDDFILSGPFS